MRRTRLVESRAVFLAYVLAKCNFSTIEGLHRRFPLIWKRRDQYKYYKHICLERTTFKEEYQLKCAARQCSRAMVGESGLETC